MFNLFSGDIRRYYSEEPRPGMGKGLFEYSVIGLFVLCATAIVAILIGLAISPFVAGIGKLLLAMGLCGLVALRMFDEWCKQSSTF